MRSEVSIVDCPSYRQDEVDHAVIEAFRRIGTLERYVRKGYKVLLKVNLLQPAPPEKCITTHPAVVEALCKMLKGIGAQIWIGDSSGPFLPNVTEKALDKSGIRDVAKRYGAKVFNFDNCRTRAIINKENEILKKIITVEPVLDADIIISMPKLKTHMLTKYTGAVKNMFGALPGTEKPKAHKIAQNEAEFAKILIDIYQNITPQLVLMDGVVGMEGLGPSHGRRKESKLILAANNALAMDIIAARIMGFKKNEIQTNNEAVDRNLIDELEIQVHGQMRNLRFKKPMMLPKPLLKIASNFLKARPKVDNKVCIKCRTCIEGCPVKAIDDDFRIDNRKCIVCYCCHELCPNNAMKLRINPFLNSYIGFIKLWKR